MRRLVCVLLCFVIYHVISADPTWCGKHYQAPGPYIPFPRPLDDKAMIVTPGLLPYDRETEGHIVATIKEDLPNFPYTFRGVIEGQAGEVLVETQVKAGGKLFIPFDLNKLPISTKKTDVSCQLIESDSMTPIATETVHLYRVPHREETAKVDYMTHGYLVNDEPFFPVGYFYSWDNYLSKNITILDQMKLDGFNVFQARPSLLPESLWEQFMNRAHELGIKVHWSLEHYYKDLDLVRYHINRWKDHPAIFAWYTADEPDGPGVAPSVVLEAQKLIKELDPYHPTTVVLNCLTSTQAYWHTTDVLMADPYPIGVDMTPCNLTYGVCGCDDCIGDVTDAPHRVDIYHGDTFNTKPVWMIPQSFGTSEWWSTQPDPSQGRYMSYSMIVHGNVNGFLYFMKGSAPSDVNPALYIETSKIAKEMPVVYPFILLGEDIPLDVYPKDTTEVWKIPYVDARAWKVGHEVMLIVTNPTDTRFPFKITLPIQVENIRRLFTTEDTQTDLDDGNELQGDLIPLDVHVYLMNSHVNNEAKILK